MSSHVSWSHLCSALLSCPPCKDRRLFYVPEWNQPELDRLENSLEWGVFGVSYCIWFIIICPQTPGRMWRALNSSLDSDTTGSATISSHIRLKGSNNPDSFGPLFPFKQSQIIQIIWILPQIIFPLVWVWKIRAHMGPQSQTRHIFNIYRQKSSYTGGNLPTKRSGDCCTDQIQKWPGGRGINQRGRNNKQEPEPWNNKTRFLSRDSRKAQNYDIYGDFDSPPVESEQIYEISRGCSWLWMESFAGLVTLTHTSHTEQLRPTLF